MGKPGAFIWCARKELEGGKTKDARQAFSRFMLGQLVSSPSTSGQTYSNRFGWLILLAFGISHAMWLVLTRGTMGRLSFGKSWQGGADEFDIGSRLVLVGMGLGLAWRVLFLNAKPAQKLQ